MKDFKYPAVLVAILLISFGAQSSDYENAEPITVKDAQTDIVVAFDGPCPRPIFGRWVAATNSSKSRRVYATVQIDSSPSSFPVRRLDNIIAHETYPQFVGILLMPGEKKRIGCERSAISGTLLNVNYSYAIPGAYYPIPDTSFPDLERAEDYVRFYERLTIHLPTPQVCRTDDAPTAIFLVGNRHPTKKLVVSITGVQGDPIPLTVALAPQDWQYVGCNTNNLKVVHVRFAP